MTHGRVEGRGYRRGVTTCSHMTLGAKDNIRKVKIPFVPKVIKFEEPNVNFCALKLNLLYLRILC